MTRTHLNAVIALGSAIAGVIVGLLLHASVPAFGGVYNNVTNYFSDGISVGSASQFSVSNAGAVTTSGAVTTTGDATVSGGTLTVTTSNTATSTATAGCIQTYATSTATPIKLVMQATTTQGIAGQVAANVANFVMLGQYGACPNL